MKESVTIIEEWPIEVNNFKTSDGKLFSDRDKAVKHQEELKKEIEREQRSDEARKWLVRAVNSKTKFKVQGKLSSFVSAVADVISMSTPAELASFLDKPVIAVPPSEKPKEKKDEIVPSNG